MRKSVLTILLSLIPSLAMSHTFVNDAGNIDRGTLSNSRLDPSSVTMKSSEWGSSVDTATTAIRSSLNIVAIDTTTLQSNIDAIPVANASIYPYKITVGTTSTFGANIVSTRTSGFDFAISSVGGYGGSASGTIYIQAGDYEFTGNTSTIPKGVNLIFDSGAWVKSNPLTVPNTVFNVSGTVTNAQIDFTTHVPVGYKGLINMLGWGKVNGGEIKFRITTYHPGTYTPAVLNLGSLARNAEVNDLLISSISVEAGGTAAAFSLFQAAGSTGSIVRNLKVSRPQMGAWTTAPLAQVNGSDGFSIEGGLWEWDQNRIMEVMSNAGTEHLRGFKWNGTRIVQHRDPAVNALVRIESGGSMQFSSGNVVSNLSVRYTVPTTQETLNCEAGINFGGFHINGLSIYHNTSGNTGGGFALPYSGCINWLFTNNSIWGTSTCFSDSGSGNKWTDASGGGKNFCNGVGQ